MKNRIIGLDLDFPYSQISFYSESSGEPETVSVSREGQNYLIPTPKELYTRIEESAQSGIMELANFIQSCLGLVNLPAGTSLAEVHLMVTMKEMRLPWTQALRQACDVLGVGAVYLQTHRESFFAYTLSQKKDLWLHKVALFEYEETKIVSYVLDVDYGTKPALVSVTPGEVLELGYMGRRSPEEWDHRRDQLFLELIQKTFSGEAFSSTFLIGESFDKTWAVDSLQYLCRRRHVFQGRNLYTKGACYAACQRAGRRGPLASYLYQSEDLVVKNISMHMRMRGKEGSYLLVSAGKSWYESQGSCEFLLDGTEEIVLYGKSMVDGETASYSISLPELPERPPRTTRLELRAEFTSPDCCKVTIRDLGFGEFFAPSGLVWESELDLE